MCAAPHTALRLFSKRNINRKQNPGIGTDSYLSFRELFQVICGEEKQNLSRKRRLGPGKRAVAPRSGYFQGLVFIHPPLREGHRPRAQRDALTLTVWAAGRVTLTLANAADHENEQSGGRCGPHHWILWTMIVVGVARPPHSISGTTYRAPRL